MRKVTGYIGALIIVMALMGSILAGYALNINGTTAVVNEYEEVTDVSGLYSHTQEKTYIDYNPASNYIGYSTEPTKKENTATDQFCKFKELKEGAVSVTPTSITAFGKTYPLNDFSRPGSVLWSEFAWMYNGIGWVAYVGAGGDFQITSFQMVRTGNNLDITVDGTTTHYTTSINPIIYYPYSDYDYSAWGSSGYLLYYGDTAKIRYNTDFTPNNAQGDHNLISYGGVSTYRTVPSNTVHNQQLLNITGTTTINNGINRGNINLNNPGSATSIYSTWVYVPRVISTTNPIGIDYSESTRVNNYPIEYENLELQNVAHTNINLYNTSLTDYDVGGRAMLGNVPHGTINGQEYSGYLYGSTGDYSKLYKMADILSTISIPENTTQIIIETGRNLVNVSGSTDLGTINNLASVAQNTASIITATRGPTDPPTGATNWTDRKLINSDGFKAYYYPDTGLVDVYNYSGVKLFTSNIADTFVYFLYCTNGEPLSSNTGLFSQYVNGTEYRGKWWYPNGSQAFLDITTVSNGALEIVHYMDITRGVKIKSDGVVPVTWNNEYENGIINLLFRAETTYSTYHNTITIGTDTISVDYTNGRFYVTLNNDEPIDIGTWRNIVLNVDLINKMVTVNPVRTFNSYTNVVVDDANISIGVLSGTAAPTNKIIWQTTPNSFTFNVYNTSVFLNTYGVVMVNPQLNITNYFTDLNNFYQLYLHNFSTYGDSITVNGVTGTVSGNTVTFGNESATLNKTKITYADGHAYIEDSNINIDLGEITDNNIILSGVWYFETSLSRGYTTTSQTYEWDWGDFIFNNTQFCVFYIGIAFIGLIVARRFCILSVIDYAVFITSIIVALSLQVIA